MPKTKGNKKNKKQHLNNHTKRLYCNPKSRRNRLTPQTCFTPHSAKLLKDYYNSQNPESAIHSTDGRVILREIQNNADNQCRNDLCLIKSFAKNKDSQNKLKALLFPPPKPDEWDDDPDTWLTNFDIMDVLNQYEESYPHFAFIGPSPIDYNTRLNQNRCVCQKLCNLSLSKYLNNIDPKRGVPVTKIGIVFNLDPHNKGGSHWVAMFVDLEDNFIFFFNSTGARIPKRINTLATNIVRQGKQLTPPKNIDFHQNTLTEHQKGNTECGMYCMYFLITMLLREKEISHNRSGGSGEENVKMSKQELIDYFKGKKGRITDKVMFEKRNEYFSPF